MVQAILTGRKRQTRRVIKPDIVNQFDICPVDGPIAYINQATGDSYKPVDVCPYQPGSVLWVKETWARISDVTDVDPDVGLNDGYLYRADGVIPGIKWRPSIFMPKAAARLWLEVVNVRIERLDDISYDDCLSEGMWGYGTDVDTLAAYQEVWQSLNAKRGYGWETNPGVGCFI
jgi:hypothetical protein